MIGVEGRAVRIKLSDKARAGFRARVRGRPKLTAARALGVLPVEIANAARAGRGRRGDEPLGVVL